MCKHSGGERSIGENLWAEASAGRKCRDVCVYMGHACVRASLPACVRVWVGGVCLRARVGTFNFADMSERMSVQRRSGRVINGTPASILARRQNRNIKLVPTIHSRIRRRITVVVVVWNATLSREHEPQI